MLLLSWFGVGSLYLSLVVIFTLAFNGLVPQATEQVLWTFALVYSFLTLLQVCVCNTILCVGILYATLKC
jgi:hypothetical protein